MQRKSSKSSSYNTITKKLTDAELAQALDESNKSCHKVFLQKAYQSLSNIYRIEDVDLNKIDSYTTLPWRDKGSSKIIAKEIKPGIPNEYFRYTREGKLESVKKYYELFGRYCPKTSENSEKLKLMADAIEQEKKAQCKVKK